jgi:hypothetical protein
MQFVTVRQELTAACRVFLSQVIAFDQFCANVQRDVFSVLAMHQDNTVPGATGCKGNAPIIAGLNIPVNEPVPEETSGDLEKQLELASSSITSEAAVITITATSGVRASAAAAEPAPQSAPGATAACCEATGF